MNYYNEFDHSAAEWLRQLIADGLIPPGDVDERSICDVGAVDLAGYTQCHFFAGIGGWSLALKLAGWPDDLPVWTGSCPCQCFSTAGKQRGFDDERDLWPVFARLIGQCRPPVVFGEQVEAAIKFGWLDRVHSDMEAEGYACGEAVLGAHSVSAPHRRYRLYWGCAAVADTTMYGYPASDGLRKEVKSSQQTRTHIERKLERSGDDSGIQHPTGDGRDERRTESGRGCASCGCGSSTVDDSESRRRRICNPENLGPADGEIDPLADSGDCSSAVADADCEQDNSTDEGRLHAKSCCKSAAFRVADGGSAGLEGRAGKQLSDQLLPRETGMASLSPWSNSRYIYCRDQKIRRIPAESIFLGVADGISSGVDGSGIECISESGGFPLTTRKEGRAMLLKGCGNAIVPQVAAEFIMAFTGGIKWT